MKNNDLPKVLQTAPAETRSPVILAMRLVTQAGQILRAVIDIPFRFIFGRDVFISYSRRDARKYVQNLVRALQERMPKLSIYLDRWIAPPAGKLPISLRLQLRWSSILVVVCTKNAIGSEFVKDEVATFARLRRKVVLVDVDGAYTAVRGEVPWIEVSGADPEEESRKIFETGNPSGDVIDRIIKSVQFTTQDRRLRRATVGTFAFVILAIGGTALYSRFTVRAANEAARAAESRAIDATKKADDADRRAATAEQRVSEADRLIVEANKKRESAEKLAASAEQSRLVAEQKTAEAENKRETAETEAAKQQGIAQSRAKANESAQLLRAGPQRIRDAVRTAEQAVRLAEDAGATTTESYTALASSLSMLPSLRVRRTLPTAVFAAFSPDAQSLAATGLDGRLQLFRTGDLQSKESVPAAPINVKVGERFAISDEAKFVAVADSNHVRIIDRESAKVVCEFVVKNQYKIDRPATTQGEDVIAAIALSPDGKYLAVAANHRTGDEIEAPEETREFVGVVTLWHVDLKTKQGTEIANLGDKYNQLSDIAFGVRGNVLAAGSKGGAILWNLSNVMARVGPPAKRTDEQPDPIEQGEPATQGKDLDASRNEFAGASTVDFELERVAIPQSGSQIRVAPGDDLSQFATVAGNDVTIWRRTDLGSYEPLAFLPLTKKVDDFSFDLQGDGLTVVSTGGQVSKTLFEIWETSDYYATTEIPSGGKFLSLFFTDKNALLAHQYRDNDEDTEDLGIIWPEALADPGPPPRLRFTSQSGLVLAEGRYVVDHTGENYYVEFEVEGKKKFNLPKSYTMFSGNDIISEDGRLLAKMPETAYGKEVHFFKLRGSSYKHLTPIRDLDNKSWYALSMARDGSLIAYTNTRGKVILRTPDGPSRALPLDIDIGTVSNLLLSPHGVYLATRQSIKEGTGSITKITVFRTTDGKRMGEIRQSIYDFAFSPDDKFLATAGFDKLTNLLDIGAGTMQQFNHLYPVTKIMFSPHSDSFATVSTGGNDCDKHVNNIPSENLITVFDLKTRSKTRTLTRKGCIDLLSFSQNGNYLAVSGWLRGGYEKEPSVTVWNIRSTDLRTDARRRLSCLEGSDSDNCNQLPAVSP